MRFLSLFLLYVVQSWLFFSPHTFFTAKYIMLLSVADENPKCVSVFAGLSLDHQTVSAASRVRLSEREEECLSCYLQACDTALLYLQELDKVFFFVFILFTSTQHSILLVDWKWTLSDIFDQYKQMNYSNDAGLI